MKKIVLSLLCVFLSPLYCVAQKSVSDLLPAHASALQEFLSSRPELDFMSERLIDRDNLKYMRENRGARFTPYYPVTAANGNPTRGSG